MDLAGTWSHLLPWELGYDKADILFAYSRYILPHPVDWPANAHVTGYWQLPIPADWTPPIDLVQFLESGPTPVYFGPGSMRSEKLQGLLSMVVSSARKLGQRVVFDVPPEDIPKEFNRNDIISAKGIPHAWLFPKMSYVIHHGGSGTSGSTVTAGVPNSGLAFSVDQSFWAKRLYLLGIGPSALPASRLIANHVVRMILGGIGNADYRSQAEKIREKISGEDGIAKAISIIHERLGI